MSKIDVKIPDIGDFKNIPVIEILVKVGDVVKADDPLLSLESDKATMEVPSPQAGKIAAILVKVGDKVSEGTPIVQLESDGTVSAAAPVSAPAAAASSSPASSVASAPVAAPQPGVPTQVPHAVPVDADFDGIYASPSIRRIARELDIDLSKISGTGPKGRITKEDIKAALGGGSGSSAASGGAGIPEIPAVDFAKFGPIESKPLSRIKRLSGPHLHRAWLNIPHVTHTDEADISHTEAFRKELDDKAKADQKKPYRVSLLPFLMKAAVQALKTFPDFNASLSPTKDALIYKKYYHIGIAVDTPDGLVVPVIRDVDKKGVAQLSQELGELSVKAREGKLSATDMQGGTFSISSLGGIGGTAFTPIVNAPEVAILGVVRSRMAPVWDGKDFVPRLMLPLCLSYDHRVVDGAAAARFTRLLADTVTDVRRLIV